MHLICKLHADTVNVSQCAAVPGSRATAASRWVEARALKRALTIRRPSADAHPRWDDPAATSAAPRTTNRSHRCAHSIGTFGQASKVVTEPQAPSRPRQQHSEENSLALQLGTVLLASLTKSCSSQPTATASCPRAHSRYDHARLPIICYHARKSLDSLTSPGDDRCVHSICGLATHLSGGILEGTPQTSLPLRFDASS